MLVLVAAHEVLNVKLEGTDGAFQIHFDSEEFPLTITVLEAEGLVDDADRKGVLYQETFKHGE